MAKEVIATDIDEVLFPFVDEFSVWHNAEYGTNISAESFHCYDFELVIGQSIPETIHRIDAFLAQDHTTTMPLELAKESIGKLTESYDVKAVTARHPRHETATQQYLTAHFQEIFGLTLIGHPRTIETVVTKAEICRQIGARALIDDSLGHVTICAQEGMEGLLFGDYIWNQYTDLPERVTHTRSWQEVLDYFGV